MNVKIIGLYGNAGSGKDTVANMIVKHSQYHDYENRKFAYKLKQIASILTGIPQERFEDPEYKANGYLPAAWNIDDEGYPVRKFLQRLGTEAIRESLHTKAWEIALWSDYKPYAVDSDGDDVYPDWVISDMRFPNEYESVRVRDGLKIHIGRPGYKPANNHKSDGSLDNHGFDIYINNDGTLTQLESKVLHIIEKYEL